MPDVVIADVAVNRAVMNGAEPGPARQTGSIRRTVPAAIAHTNATDTVRAGCGQGRRTGQSTTERLGNPGDTTESGDVRQSGPGRVRVVRPPGRHRAQAGRYQVEAGEEAFALGPG